MHTISATTAKQNFGALLDSARREPVAIEKNGRPVAVVLATEELEKLVSMAEDKYWAHLAERNIADSDYLSELESNNFLDELLN